MVKALETMNLTVQRKTEASHHLLKVSQNGSKQIRMLMDDFKQGVASRISQVQEILIVIKDISEKTNILGLNAAIESAHAGQYGKGFSVVAEEIRNMAESTAESSQSITQLVEEITEAVHATQISAEKTNEAFHQIEMEVQEVFQAFEEILANNEEMSAGSSQIIQAQESLTQISTRVREKARDISQEQELIKTNYERSNSLSEEVTSLFINIGEEIKGIDIRAKEIHELSATMGQTVQELHEGIEQVER